MSSISFGLSLQDIFNAADAKQSVRLASTAALDSVYYYSGGASNDGETIAYLDLILIKDQVDTATNGLYVAGRRQVETATVLGTVTGSGNATVIVTSTAVTGSPLTIPVAVLNTDTASQVATKIRTALNAEIEVSSDFTIGGAGAVITLTAVLTPGNDATLNLSIDNGTCTGLTAAPTSTNTTEGIATVRAENFDSWDEIVGATVAVEEGTLNGDTLWICEADTGGVVGVDAIVFSQIGDVTYKTTYGIGTAYVLTNSAAAVVFGSTSPIIVLDKAGTYLLFAQVTLDFANATVTNQTAALKVRRTNNTAADLSAVLALDLPVMTTLTHSYGTFQIPPFIYQTQLANDSITIFANVSAALTPGSLNAVAIGTSIVAVRLY